MINNLWYWYYNKQNCTIICSRKKALIYIAVAFSVLENDRMKGVGGGGVSGAVMNNPRAAEKKAGCWRFYLIRSRRRRLFRDVSRRRRRGSSSQGVKGRITPSLCPATPAAYLICTNFSCTSCKRQSYQWVKAFCISSRPRPPRFILLIR